jgi:hypothetical protein
MWCAGSQVQEIIVVESAASKSAIYQDDEYRESILVVSKMAAIGDLAGFRVKGRKA